LEKTDKTVLITIRDGVELGTYDILDPCPISIRKTKNQKIVWCIVYEGDFTEPTNVIIDQFRADSGATNPFGNGTDSDNKFDIPFDKFACQVKTKNAKSDAPLETFKYRIRAFVLGEQKEKPRDPQVIINN
jgi:hypothetical protein